MRAVFAFLATLGLAISAGAAEHGHSVSGPAPVGAAGPAPVHASGPAPVGGTGTLVRSYTGSYHSGFTNPTGAFAGRGHYPNTSRSSLYQRRRGPYGAAAPFLYGGVGYLDPDLGYDDDWSANPYTAPPNAQPDDALTQHYQVQENMLGAEIERLNEEIDALREQSGGGQLYPPPQAQNQPDTPPPPPVTVVLRDGKRFQSSDFAVMNGVFWDFSKTPTRRVLMSEVNVPASVQASAADGAQFPD